MNVMYLSNIVPTHYIISAYFLHTTGWYNRNPYTLLVRTFISLHSPLSISLYKQLVCENLVINMNSHCNFSVQNVLVWCFFPSSWIIIELHPVFTDKEIQSAFREDNNKNNRNPQLFFQRRFIVEGFVEFPTNIKTMMMMILSQVEVENENTRYSQTYL